MSQADFLGRAIEQVKKAIETDTAGDYEAAYQQYYAARKHYVGKMNWAVHADNLQWSCSCLP